MTELFGTTGSNLPHPSGMDRRRLSIVLLLAGSASLLGQAPGGIDDAFARLDRSAPQFKSVSADLKRNVHTAVINDDARDMGTIRAKRDKSRNTRMLIHFTAPDEKSVSIDGTEVSVYLPKQKTVQIYQIGSKRNLVDQFLLLGFGATSSELKSNYDVTYLGKEPVGSASTWHLQLIPKSADALKNLKKAELWIGESGLPAQQKFTTSSTGDFMLITYLAMKPNSPLSDNDVKLSWPKGVTVEHPQL